MASDDLAGEHRHVPWHSLLWLPLIVVIGLVVTSSVEGRERWTLLHAALLVAPLLAAHLLIVLLLHRRIETSATGIEQSGFLVRRSLRWDAVRSVEYKTGGMHNGYHQSDKIILRGPGGKVVVNSDYGDFAGLRRHIDEALVAADGPRLADAIAADEKSWRAYIFAPHLEDLGLWLLTVTALGGAFFGAVRLAQTSWFLAIGAP